MLLYYSSASVGIAYAGGGGLFRLEHFLAMILGLLQQSGPRLFLIVIRLLGEPLVLLEFVYCGPVFSIETQHFLHEVLKLIGKILAAHLLPVFLVLAVHKQFVEVLVLGGLLEGENALNNYKQNYSERKYVRLLPVVSLAVLDLGSHVGHGALVRFQFVHFLVGCESEVGHLDPVLLVKENIFQLEVAMDDVFFVHVGEHFDELFEEETTSILPHGSQVLAKIEKQPT